MFIAVTVQVLSMRWKGVPVLEDSNFVNYHMFKEGGKCSKWVYQSIMWCYLAICCNIKFPGSVRKCSTTETECFVRNVVVTLIYLLWREKQA